MPLGEDVPQGICRLFSAPPQPVSISVSPAPDYAQSPVDLQPAGPGICINGVHWLYASHALTIEGTSLQLDLPAGEEGWAMLADVGLLRVGLAHLLEGAHQPLLAELQQPEVVGGVRALGLEHLDRMRQLLVQTLPR